MAKFRTSTKISAVGELLQLAVEDTAELLVRASAPLIDDLALALPADQLQDRCPHLALDGVEDDLVEALRAHFGELGERQPLDVEAILRRRRVRWPLVVVECVSMIAVVTLATLGVLIIS